MLDWILVASDDATAGSVIQKADRILHSSSGSDLKADIIESAVHNPSVPSKASKIEDVAVPLISEYQTHGYPVDDLSKIQNLSTLPSR
jgi:hypothetical protein